jgi:hypothetical protein
VWGGTTSLRWSDSVTPASDWITHYLLRNQKTQVPSSPFINLQA